MRTIKLSEDIVDEIVVSQLKEYFEVQVSEIENIKRVFPKNKRPSHKQEDLIHAKKVKKACRTLLSYCMLHQDFNEYMENFE